MGPVSKTVPRLHGFDIFFLDSPSVCYSRGWHAPAPATVSLPICTPLLPHPPSAPCACLAILTSTIVHARSSLRHMELKVGDDWAHQVRLVSGDASRALRLMTTAHKTLETCAQGGGERAMEEGRAVFCSGGMRPGPLSLLLMAKQRTGRPSSARLCLAFVELVVLGTSENSPMACCHDDFACRSRIPAPPTRKLATPPKPKDMPQSLLRQGPAADEPCRAPDTTALPKTIAQVRHPAGVLWPGPSRLPLCQGRAARIGPEEHASTVTPSDDGLDHAGRHPTLRGPLAACSLDFPTRAHPSLQAPASDENTSVNAAPAPPAAAKPAAKRSFGLKPIKRGSKAGLMPTGKKGVPLLSLDKVGVDESIDVGMAGPSSVMAL